MYIGHSSLRVCHCEKVVRPQHVSSGSERCQKRVASQIRLFIPHVYTLTLSLNLGVSRGQMNGRFVPLGLQGRFIADSGVPESMEGPR